MQIRITEMIVSMEMSRGRADDVAGEDGEEVEVDGRAAKREACS